MIIINTLIIMYAIDILSKEMWFHILDYIDDNKTFNQLQFVCQLFNQYYHITEKYTISDNNHDIKIIDKNQCMIFRIMILDVLICHGGPCVRIQINGAYTDIIKIKMYLFELEFFPNFCLDTESYEKNFDSLDKMLKHLQSSIQVFHINKVFEIFTNQIICINNTFNKKRKKYVIRNYSLITK